MPVFEKPPLETLPPARERWTPLYLEHGRIEVDDASVKWIGADRTVLRLPVASLSVLMLGPGTTVTHAAMKACADSDTPVCWVGADGMRFYAFGVTPTHDNERARRQAEIASSPKRRDEVARRMFLRRFPDVNVANVAVKELRGMEGRRVKALYAEMGTKYGVSWKGRNYDASNWDVSDTINRAVSAANAALYALTTSVVCSMGYLPQLGFIHTAGTLPFVFDIADMYKPETTLPAAFETVSLDPKAKEESVVTRLKSFIESTHLLARMPKDIEKLLEGA
ncbi:MAG: type I-E CRISPR-associated endonuclease Cas1e [Kiritimatiellae bacterium]|nr:type I-E CRISPR-associated endonuclease Cas1e [Kiritimatiellia bacterium]